MFSIFSMVTCLIVIFIPFLPLFKLVYPLNQMYIMGINKGIERDIFSPFDNLKLKDFYNFKSFININFNYLENYERDNIYDLCLKALKGFFYHLLTGFIYLFLILLLIINLFLNFISHDKITIINQVLWIISLLIPFSIFYLIPFLRLIKKVRLANFLEFLFIRFLHFPDIVVKYIWKSIVIIFKFIILIVYMSSSIYIWALIPKPSYIRVEILYYLVCLGIYHYGINYLLGTLFNKLDKKGYPNISLEHSRRMQKNFNCLSMLIIYVIAYLIKIETSGIFIAITLIFLLDTFISTQQQIIKEYKSKEM